ncbi:MAG TPA: prepilin peptidase [Oscillospiraceae bacterium]|nr:prepilin peptidase [Oscillospiraceae bacterium]
MQFFVLSIFVIICLVTDLRERKIYNKVIIAGLVSALVINIILQGFVNGLRFTVVGLLMGIILLLLPFIMGGLGAGDVKMLGMIGAFTGSSMVVQILLISALVGGVFALITMAKEGRILMRLAQLFKGLYCFIFTRKSLHLGGLHETEASTKSIPYGVALSVGVLIVYILGSMEYVLPGFS